MHFLSPAPRVGALALGASLFFSLAACGDDSIEDGSGGAGGAATSTSSSGSPTTSVTTSSSSGVGGDPDGSGGAGGGTGGQGTGGQGTGGEGTGGEGTGGTTAWSAPACDTVEGTPAVTFTTDEGATIAERTDHLSGVSYGSSIVALDTPNTLLVIDAGILQRSTDAGCTFEEVGPVPSEAFAKLVAAPGGKAYGFSDPDLAIFAVEGDTVTDLPLPGEASPVGLIADPADAEHVRLALNDGTLWDSTDGGQTWSPLGDESAPDGCFYTAAFDPADLDHVVCGTITSGTWITTDGGDSWARAESDVLWSQTFTVTISPVDGDVVWIEGFENGLHDGEVVGVDQRHVWRSTDGGASFTTVFVESDTAEGDLDGVNLYNGNVLAAHPTDPDVLYYLFGVPPRFEENYGALYRVEAGSGAITVEAQFGTDIDDYGAIAFNPADPGVIYLALSSERPSEG